MSGREARTPVPTLHQGTLPFQPCPTTHPRSTPHLMAFQGTLEGGSHGGRGLCSLRKQFLPYLNVTPATYSTFSTLRSHLGKG